MPGSPSTGRSSWLRTRPRRAPCAAGAARRRAHQPVTARPRSRGGSGVVGGAGLGGTATGTAAARARGPGAGLPAPGRAGTAEVEPELVAQPAPERLDDRQAVGLTSAPVEREGELSRAARSRNGCSGSRPAAPRRPGRHPQAQLGLDRSSRAPTLRSVSPTAAVRAHCWSANSSSASPRHSASAARRCSRAPPASPCCSSCRPVSATPEPHRVDGVRRHGEPVARGLAQQHLGAGSGWAGGLEGPPQPGDAGVECGDGRRGRRLAPQHVDEASALTTRPRRAAAPRAALGLHTTQVDGRPEASRTCSPPAGGTPRRMVARRTPRDRSSG
jgi:hypothetical protein